MLAADDLGIGLKMYTVRSALNEDQVMGNLEQLGARDKRDKGNFFMDLYSIQTGPKQVEFGHVFEDPNAWEQRYEKKDHENKRFQGQARWGDKNGGYGEQYWDFNHGDDSGNEGAANDDLYLRDSNES